MPGAWWLLPREKEVVVWLSCCYGYDMIVVFDVVVVLCGEGALSDIRMHLEFRRRFCSEDYDWDYVLGCASMLCWSVLCALHALCALCVWLPCYVCVRCLN